MEAYTVVKILSYVLVACVGGFLFYLWLDLLFLNKLDKKTRAQLKEFIKRYTYGKVPLSVSKETFRARYRQEFYGSGNRMFVGNLKDDDTFEFWYEIRTGFMFFTMVWTSIKGRIEEKEILFEMDYYNADPPVDYERLVGKLKELAGDESPLYSEAIPFQEGEGGGGRV